MPLSLKACGQPNKMGVLFLTLLFLGGCFSPQGKPIPPGGLPPPSNQPPPTENELKPRTDWPGPDRLKLWSEGKWFMVGANYPWLHYGHDFGHASPWVHDGVSTRESMLRVDSDFSYLAKAGVHVLRWFVFGDGRTAPEFNAAGDVMGLDDAFYKDMDAALSLAQRHNIHLVFVLLDFPIARPETMSNGVKLGGRESLFLPEHRQSFFNNALKPLLAKYGKHPNIFAWEVMNEPEGAMRLDKDDANHPVDPDVMKSFMKEAVKFIHDHSDRQVTIGSKSRKYVDLWVDSDLDFCQYHYYDRLEGNYPLAYPYATLNTEIHLKGKPCVIGEFPTKSTSRTLKSYFDIIHQNGYAGAWAWSYGASDEFSDLSRKTSELTQWLTDYEATNTALPR